MIGLDEDALICDLAETYQIYDYRQLPPLRVAVFACGLRENSRIKMRANGQVVPTDTMLLAGISDMLSMLVWFKTKDGQKGKNRPTMLTSLLSGKSESENEKDVIVFNSGEEFEKRRKELMAGGE